ncbi:ParA family protein [Parabacteroides chinchillae]|uniref:Cellulose biosynthesis protein BcsQ n=1 Tax=Parabacteroides chinchillae TaxID=871327 RepID=A0A8G2BX08_9BACT|nr:ParA family protein [Parabacteroides chinchillae]SEF96085.1 Cellulose biosynthesis protein BcsQ [Parabacteroides chinchillae]
MKKDPIFIAFSTQKGGAGKTTLTVLTASFLHYVKGYNVAVVDCDYPQFSVTDMRERDLRNVERNPYLKKLAFEQFKKISKRAYPILESRPEDAIETVKCLLDTDTPPDVIFFDFPGTVNNHGVINTIATMDYIFCPIAADRVVMESSLTFAGLVNDTLVSTGQSNIKGLYLLWNMVDKREKTDLYDIYEKIAGEMGLTILKNFIPDSKRFRKEGPEDGDKALFRSTLFPPDKLLCRGSNIDALVEEILSLVKAKP